MNDSSFEDVETQYTKDAAKRLLHRKHLLNRKSMPNLGPNSLSTISSDATAVQNQSTDPYWNQNNQINKGMDIPNPEYYEFQSKQKYFDKMTQNYREDRSPTKRSSLFALQVNNNISHNNNKSLQEQHYLKHPKSMMNLHVRSQNSENNDILMSKYKVLSNSNDKLKNAVSYHNLRQPVRSSSVRFKSSVTQLNDMGSTHISPIREDIDNILDYEYDNYNQYGDETNDTVIISRTDRDEEFLNKFSEEQETMDEGFLNNSDDDEDILKPRFLSNLPTRNRVTPSSFSKTAISEEFNGIKRRESGRLNGSPMSRIQTIKQTIDSNNPNTISKYGYNDNNVDDENVFYNPKTNQWVRKIDDDLVNRFNEININGKKRMISESKDQVYSLKNLKKRSHSRKPTIVNNMVLDEKNQRWVSISGDEPDPFADIPDYPLQSISQKNSSTFLRSHSSKYEELSPRKTTKNIPREYSPVNHQMLRRNPSVRHSNNNNIAKKYFIDSYTLEKFYHEENRWNKIVGSWFVARINEPDIRNKHDIHTTNSNSTNQDRNSFMYEIRNMVMNSTRQ